MREARTINMEGFIRITMFLAYLCYLHPHVELNVVKNISNPNTQLFISMSIVVAISYLILMM